MTRIHLIGIGGTGLSAIARVLLEMGHTVSGSDRVESPFTRDLQSVGVTISIGHRPENVRGADLVVRSSAILDDNPEVIAARALRIPVLKRADFLGSLMDGKTGIAIAGTHGKTTTTSMIAWMLSALGQDPSFIVGGVPTNLGVNARAGKGDIFVIEADEYDRMFLGLKPTIEVVTNIEHDHPDCYLTPADYQAAFVEFMYQLTGPPGAPLGKGGTLVACAEDPGACDLMDKAEKLGKAVIPYGIVPVPARDGIVPVPAYHPESPTGRDGLLSATPSSVVVPVPGRGVLRNPSSVSRLPSSSATGLAPNEKGGFTFSASVLAEGVTVELQVPGKHNVRNALAALTVAQLLHLPLAMAARALDQFTGTGRRFEVRGEANGVVIVDDYAHHPTEIRATLAAARTRYPSRRIWAVWQPHTYSRTHAMIQEFADAFADADEVIVTEIYAAREPKQDFSSKQVVEAMPRPAHFIAGLSEVSNYLITNLRPGDALLVLSAGDADQISTEVLTHLKEARNG
ncbi:MAG: UDP-N-acetylmuramate--L-alanine ligase [Candidatus Atribacteria bacterium]|nr:UDP-N-acetylmuramate--L-alanine ligase [Candidatus Atribacteria bacterium]